MGDGGRRHPAGPGGAGHPPQSGTRHGNQRYRPAIGRAGARDPGAGVQRRAHIAGAGGLRQQRWSSRRGGSRRYRPLLRAAQQRLRGRRGHVRNDTPRSLRRRPLGRDARAGRGVPAGRRGIRRRHQSGGRWRRRGYPRRAALVARLTRTAPARGRGCARRWCPTCSKPSMWTRRSSSAG